MLRSCTTDAEALQMLVSKHTLLRGVQDGCMLLKAAISPLTAPSLSQQANRAHELSLPASLSDIAIKAHQ